MSLEPPSLQTQTQRSTNESHHRRHLFIWGCVSAVAVVAFVCYTALPWRNTNPAEEPREQVSQQRKEAWTAFKSVNAKTILDTHMLSKFGDHNYVVTEYPTFGYDYVADVFYGRGKVSVKTSNQGWVDTTYEIGLSPSGAVKTFSVSRFE